jgi:hypothetical protein
MFVFEPNPDDCILESQAPHMISFYPNQSIDRLKHHIETVVQDLISFIIIEIAREINTQNDSVITMISESDSIARL